MPMNSFITFYPVGNGDTILLKFDDKTTIQLDCKIRKSSQSDKNKDVDVKKELLKDLEKRNGNSIVDVFVLTHADEDHCLGFENNYYIGDPDKYSQQNKDNEEIIVGELWVTSMIFTYSHCADALAIRREVIRRKALYDTDSELRFKEGNRLFIIGYNGLQKLDKIPHYYPSNKITRFNNKVQTKIEAFLHAPFKDDLITAKAEKDRNSASIVLQFRFFEDINKTKFNARIVLGGDSDHYIWEKIIEISESNNNEDALHWNLFLSPHHCSWTYFNDTPQENNSVAKDYSLNFIDYKLSNAKIIASSKEIIDNTDNPPHFRAKKEYVDKVGANNLICLATYPSKDEPLPLQFEITKEGLVLIDALRKKKLEETANALIAGNLKSNPAGQLGDTGLKHQPTKFYAE
jgi:hypothetical protein